MRNYLALVLGLTIASTPAFASRARLESLGEGKNGSFYVDDSRNMFLNPAAINAYKKKLFLEFGSATSAVDTTANTKAQGGFTNTFGDFTYGVYLGNENDTTHNNLATFNGAFLTPDNTVDFFIGGDAGAKWGFNLFYSGNKAHSAAQRQTMSEFGTRLGVSMDKFQVFTTVLIASEAKGATVATDEYTGKVGVDVGATYSVTDTGTVFANFATSGADYKPVGTKTNELTKISAQLGYGCKKEVTKSTTMFTRVGFGYSDQKNKTTTTGLEVGTKVWNVPVVVGAETQALNWLAIRGSVAQSLLGQTFNTGRAQALAESTQVSAGIGMTFGDIVIDGLVATNGGANSSVVGNGGSNTATSGAGGGTLGNFGFGNNMITRVGLTYNL